MFGVDTIARAEREHAANLAREADFQAKITEIRARPLSETDFDAIVAADSEVAVLRRKLVLAAGVSAKSAERLEAAKAEAAEKAADAEHTAMAKRQATGAKRVRALVGRLRDLQGELDWLAAERKVFDEYNARRGKRAFVADPEQFARETPAHTVPAVTRKERQWLDSRGSGPTFLEPDGKGGWRPQTGQGDYTLRDVEVIVSPERFVGAHMPTRLADAIKLVDLEGRPL